MTKKDNKTMQISHNFNSGHNTHTFSYNPEETIIETKTINEEPSFFSPKWTYSCDKAPYKVYTAIAKEIKVSDYYVICPICGERVLIKRLKGKIVGEHLIKDERLY